MWAALKSGAWATEERLRVYQLMLVAGTMLFICGMLATSDGLLDLQGRPLGTDFSQVYVAGLEALAGAPEAPFDLMRHIAEQQRYFAARDAVFGWHYPPFFLGVAAGLAKLPYFWALGLWQFSTLAVYVGVIIAILTRAGISAPRAALAALAFPAVLVNFGHGQNGFLTAGLLGAGFLMLERRPLWAGACFGLLAYKPQFALAIPVALLSQGRWRALVAAAITVAAITVASLATLGPKCWEAFFASLPFTRRLLVEEGNIGFEKIQSVFAAVRLLGGGVPLGYLLQGLATAGALLAVAWLCRSSADGRLKSAATIAATLATTPYCLDYDMMALGPALAFHLSYCLERGFRPFEKSALAFVYVAPFVARGFASSTGIPLGSLAIALSVVLPISAAWSQMGGYVFTFGGRPKKSAPKPPTGETFLP